MNIPKPLSGRKVKYDFASIEKDSWKDMKGTPFNIASAAWHHAKKYEKHFCVRTGLDDLQDGYVRVYRDK